MIHGSRFIGLSLLCGLALLGCADSNRPSVVLITLDTTRADHLSIYGYDRDTSPRLARLAEESVVHSQAWSTSPWTLPAHASLFTGLQPIAHGAHSRLESALSLASAIEGKAAHLGTVTKLGDEFETLAEQLADHGYHTGAFLGGPWLKPAFGLMQGFEHVDDEVTSARGRGGDVLADRAIDWLAGLDPGAPYFLFVNFFDAHWPYAPAPGFDDYPGARSAFSTDSLAGGLISGRRVLTRAERDVAIARYDGEIRYQDEQLGRVLDGVRARRDGDRALIIVTADHGESFGEGGRYFHTYWLSGELLHVPLVVRYPDRRGAGSLDARPVQLTDLLPLIAAEVGFEPSGAIDGVIPGRRELAFADLYRQPLAIGLNSKRFDRDLDAVIDWPLMLVRSDRGEEELHRLGGTAERSAVSASQRQRLLSRLDARRDGVIRPEGTRPLVDEGTGELLRELGYVE